MPFLDKDLDLITIEDIEGLVKDQVRENRNIDYKRALPGDDDKSKREFLADVSSFANGEGGDLVFGMEEKAGLPTKVRGVRIRNLEESILRLEHMILDSINPRINRVSINGVWVRNDRYVIIVRVPKSFTSPHMVTYQGHGRFYSRNSSGKHPLDVSEIRSAFSFTHTNIDSVREFRSTRVEQIINNKTPIDLAKNESKIVVQLIPLSITNTNVGIDISILENQLILPKDIFSGGVVHQRFNFDGFMMYTEEGYLQIFRNGVIEIVENNFLSHRKGQKFISPEYESTILNQLEDMLNLQKKLKMNAPFMFAVSILGVKGCYLGKTGNFQWFDSQPIDRENLNLSDVFIQDYGMDLRRGLRPIFDTVWNSAGWPRSMNYDEEGNWVGGE